MTKGDIAVPITPEDYARADRFLPWNAGRRVYNAHVEPRWIDGGDRFWYLNRSRRGKAFVLVDPERGIRAPAFDHARLAAALSAATGRHCEAGGLPFSAITFEGPDSIRFEAGEEERWACDLAGYRLERIPAEPAAREGELASPDGRWAAFVRAGDVWVRPIAGGEEVRLTFDAEPDCQYATPPDSTTTAVTDRLSGKPLPVLAVWSPDSRRLATHRLDQRNVKPLHLIQGAPPDGGKRPVLHSYRVPLVGDAERALAQTVILDVVERTAVVARHDPAPMLIFSPPEAHMAFWGEDGRHLYLLQRERGDKAMRLLEVDAGSGDVRTLIEERGETYVEANLAARSRPNVRVLGGGREVIWFSERDGWGHLYLYDAGSGDCKRQITSGPFAVREIVHVDEAARRLYFTAGGREAAREPYYRHLYAAGLDGGEPVLLTPEEADHRVTFSPSGRYFVDTYGRVDLPPATLVRAAGGEQAVSLEEADCSELVAEGWRFPERFSVKARDGVTDIYGAIFRPTRFDPGKRYPVIDDIYPGPQVIRTPKTFPTDERSAFGFWHPQALAELGFVVVTIDGLGTPLRSKAFHDHGYARMEEAGGLPDHVAGLRQLAERHPYMDLSRVGIFGHSGGGFASTHAILTFPAFYRVAVASAGNHDQRGYSATWGEKYQGLLAGGNYDPQANAPLAANLRGKLLLAFGDMDDNVHPAMTIQLIDALIKANKDFDLLVLPNRNHAFAADPYFVRRRWDYFVRHLLGEEPPAYEIRKGDAQ